jgi:D-glycero-alpha-D-manno-heptose 1-phosphate guanylyltransferase
LNGDTYFDVDLYALNAHHKLSGAELTLSLKEMHDFNRYGTVDLKESRISSFIEKRSLSKGLINGGVYILNKTLFSDTTLPTKFSFEKDIMEALVTQNNMQGFIAKGYFIDIGIPDDYKKAQIELPNKI